MQAENDSVVGLFRLIGGNVQVEGACEQGYA